MVDVTPAEAAKLMIEATRFPLALRIACKLYLAGWTEAEFSAANFGEAQQPIVNSVGGYLRGLERKQAPAEFYKRLVALAVQ